MKILFSALFSAVYSLAATAQLADSNADNATLVPPTPAMERTRIQTERSALEAGFASETAACYQNFLVNNCLDDVNARRRQALADLRRQEMSLNAQDRKLKGAEQIRKSEEKSSPERKRLDAEKRAAALKDFQSRSEREKQKNADRLAAQSAPQANTEALAKRLQSQQEKIAARTARLAGAAEATRKFNERQQNAQLRKAQNTRDQLNLAKPPGCAIARAAVTVGISPVVRA